MVGDEHQVDAAQGGRDIEPAEVSRILASTPASTRSPGWWRCSATAAVNSGTHVVSRRT